MAKVASEAEFIQCDITYDDIQEYPYIFNAVAFNSMSMEWMVIARVRLNRQTAEAYALAFLQGVPALIHVSNRVQHFWVY